MLPVLPLDIPNQFLPTVPSSKDRDHTQSELRMNGAVVSCPIHLSLNGEAVATQQHSKSCSTCSPLSPLSSSPPLQQPSSPVLPGDTMSPSQLAPSPARITPPH